MQPIHAAQQLQIVLRRLSETDTRIQGNAILIDPRIHEDVTATTKVAKYLTDKEIDQLFDMKYYTKNVDYIYKRVFGSTKKSSGKTKKK